MNVQLLSVVVPVLNEEPSLEQLVEEIRRTCEANGVKFEIVFVDDGSTDGSWQKIVELHQRDRRVRGIRFRRNFGKAAALTAGMQAARGELILTMDADLQDDPAEIPNLLAKLNEGYDVVNGWKKRRLDPWHKVYPSKVFNWLVSTLTGLKLHDHNCGLKLMKAEVAREIRLYGELHRFVSVLAYSRGFRVVELPVHHRPRQYGHSKYGVRRFVRGFLDLLTVVFLTGYGRRPQHMLGAVGLFFFLIGCVGLLYLAVYWVVKMSQGIDPHIGTRPLLAYSVASALLGAQAISLGLLAELIVAYTSRETDAYSVAECLDNKDAQETSPPTAAG